MAQSNCIFCKIISGELPSKKIFEDENVIAFHDRAPSAPIHILFVPKKHFDSLNHLSVTDFGLMANLAVAIQSVTRSLKIADGGYRTIINTGADGGQTVFHLHVHVLAGKKMVEKLNE
jgi:histidine triad (HIT) family protein